MSVYQPTIVSSKPFRSRQGVQFRVDYFRETPDADTIFYCGIYATAHHRQLHAKAIVMATLISRHPAGEVKFPTRLRYFYNIRDDVTFAAPVNGTISARYPAQLALQIDDEWQEDVWQPAETAHNFNFSWID